MKGAPDIAIVGMSCVFPGAADLTAYWNNILAKLDATSDPPEDWGTEQFFDAESEENDRTYCKRGGWLGDLATFNPVELGVMPNAVDGGEPDHFLALQAAYDALVDAGYNTDLLERYKQRCEVIIGRGTYVNRGNATAIQHVVGIESLLGALKKLRPEMDQQELSELRRELKESLPPFNSDTSASLVPNIITGRIANRLDMMGANYIVDAACASSLVAVDHAVRDLQTGRCDMAVAGGVHASTPPVILVIFSHLKALSRQGKIKPFDPTADGTLLGEGVGMVVLKRLQDATRDRDRIYAVIKGVGVSSDGRALGLLAPRLEGEILAIERAYEAAGVSPETVGLVEAHGTGTVIGDGTEVEALKAVFGKRVASLPDIALGSVKSMISHTMPASGAAGLIKAALALHHRVLPPTICEKPQAKLQSDDSRFYVNTEARPWIHDSSLSPRRAGINSFGFGGVNAHAVLEEYLGDSPAPWQQTEWESELFVVSGESVSGVEQSAQRLLARARETPRIPLRNLAWQTNCSTPIGHDRMTVVATSHEDLAQKLEKAIPKLQEPGVERIKMRGGVYYSARKLAREGKVALMFPGEGAQYPNMLKDLCLHFPEVREVFELIDRAFRDHTRSRLPSQVVFPPPGHKSELIWSMDAGAEAVFCANQAVLKLVQALGIQHDAVLGHSTGEHTALLAAGIVKPDSDEEFIEHVLGVNRAFEDLKSKIPEGTLVAVGGAPRERLEELVAQNPDELFIALDNCANQVVICGTGDGVDKLIDGLAGGTAVCQRLPMARAYHTPWFQIFSDRLRGYFQDAKIDKPSIPAYSCVSADRFPDDEAAIRDLVVVSWSSTVRFRDAVNKMYDDGVRVFLEAGPRGNLSGFVGDILRGKEHIALPTDIRTRSGISQLHHMLAQLLAHGGDANLEHLYRRRAADVEPKVQRGPRVKISSGLQPMKLREDRQPAPPAAPAREPAPQTPSAPPEASRIPPGLERAPAPRPLPAATDPAQPPSSREAVMLAHLTSMADFVTAQNRVMADYLRRKGRTPAPAAPSGPTSAVETAPFVDAVAQTEGNTARLTRRLSLSRDALFLDHTLGRGVSEDDPSLDALAVVPLAVTLEILAEAAATLVPGLVCTGMRDVRASQWIVFDEPEIDLELEVKLLAPGEVEAKVRLAKDVGRPRPPCAEAVLLFAQERPTGQPRAFQFTKERPSSWAAEDLYRKGMFHGPAFRAVTSMTTVAEDGCRSGMVSLPRENLIVGEPQPRFLFDPILLDAAGQVVAFWSQEVVQPRADIFPYGLDRLECFAAPPAPGTALECRVFVTHLDERTLISDIEIVDAEGRLIYRLQSWKDRRFAPPGPFWDLRIAPREQVLSVPAEELLGPGMADPDVAAVQLEAFSQEFFETSHGIWQRALAAIVLSREERNLFAASAMTPARRREWLTGRIAAKDAVRRLLHRRFGQMPAYADVEIVADGAGRISATGAWSQRWGVKPVVSLAHSGNTAVALAILDPSRPAGIDLEPADRDVRDVEALGFTDAERELLDGVDPAHRAAWGLRFWCAKEAAGKAAGTGLRPSPQAWQVVSFNTHDGEVLVASTSDAMRYTCLTRLTAAFIFSFVTETVSTQ